MRRMVPHYVVRPVTSLLQHWELKVPLALVFGWLWWVAERVVGMYDQLLSTDPVLLLMAITILLIDWVTGIASALREGEDITSKKFRQAGWKVIEYSAIVTVCVMLANGAEGRLVEPVLGTFDDAALFYIAGTEGLSVIENVKGSQEQAIRWVKRVRKLATGQLPEIDGDSSDE